MTCTSFDQLSRISLSDLPSRVLTDVFPTFAHVLDAETSVFIGVSAGVDSMTLACLLGIRYYQQHFPLANLHILHCNHQLRSQSEIEATYVHTFFSGLDVQIFFRPDAVKTTERALRQWRYDCFQTASSLEHSRYSHLLFLGHHLEDRIESTFLNAVRGSGLRGFLNMQTFQPHPLLSFPVCRPLITITKSQIIAFCESFGVKYFLDETNANPAISQRNYLRHEIIEKLVGMNHGKSRFLKSMQQLYGEIEKGGTFLPHFYPHDLFVPISASPAWQAAYAYRTTSTNVLQIRNYFHIANNLRSSQLQERTQRLTITQSGRKEFHGVYFFFHEHQLYIIAPRPHGGSNREKFWKTYLPDQQRITRLGPQTVVGMTIEVNEERFLGSTLRFPQLGDRFAGKTRNRWCINQKIPLFWRNFIPVAVKDGNILHMRKEVMK